MKKIDSFSVRMESKDWKHRHEITLYVKYDNGDSTIITKFLEKKRAMWETQAWLNDTLFREVME